VDLTFATLRGVNVRRCIEGFKHTLESWSIAEWTNAAAGEMGEACNIAKKMLRHRDNVAGNKGDDKDLAKLREKLAREMADVVIYLDLAAAHQGIDLGRTVAETFNAKSEELGTPHRLPPVPATSEPSAEPLCRGMNLFGHCNHYPPCKPADPQPVTPERHAFVVYGLNQRVKTCMRRGKPASDPAHIPEPGRCRHSPIKGPYSCADCLTAPQDHLSEGGNE
jgi:NTP pyrophosphatase (non-canonical NTP hydrolase)